LTALGLLACAQNETRLCVLAKREVGLLYDDIRQIPYKILFNDSVSALRLWRAVEIMQIVEDVLKEQANLEGKDRLIAVHGNRFILHLVFRILHNFDSVSNEEFDGMKIRVREIALEMLAKTTAEKEKQVAGSYPANVFKNASKCDNLGQAILEAPSKPKKRSRSRATTN
jgi:hypothetical protein